MARRGRAEGKTAVRHVATDDRTTATQVVHTAVAILIIEGNRAVAAVDFILVVQLHLGRTPTARTLVLGT